MSNRRFVAGEKLQSPFLPSGSYLPLSLSLSLSSSKVHGISVGCLTGRTGRVGSGILIRFRNPFRKERERGSEWGAEWELKVGRAPTGNFSRKSIESRRSLANVPVKKITLASRSRLSLSLSRSLSLSLARSLALSPHSSPLAVFVLVQRRDGKDSGFQTLFADR